MTTSNPTFADFKNYLTQSGIFPGCQTLKLCVENARETYGDKVAQFLMDCFMPEGEPVAPGIEDSLSHYLFNATSWEELEQEWNESFNLKGG